MLAFSFLNQLFKFNDYEALEYLVELKAQD